jgi:bifunctional non-homologous end joining protein LigD
MALRKEALTIKRIIQTEGSKAFESEIMQREKRSRDWVKVKNLVDEDFLACGYIAKGEQITSLVLGSMDAPLRYIGHVTLGVSRNVACRFPTTPSCPFDMLPSGNEGAVWYKNPPICIITYMERTSAGGMRQPRFNGFRED